MCIAKVGQIVEREDGTLWALVDSGSYRSSAWRQLNVSTDEKIPEKPKIISFNGLLIPIWEIRVDARSISAMRIVGWVFDDTNAMLQLGDVMNTPDMKSAKQQYDLEKLLIAVGERKK